MKKSLICLLMLISINAYSDCDWKTGITPGPNKTFIYSEACHLKVGSLVQDNATKDQQIQDLTKAIQLKDLAINMSDQRVALWEKTADDEMARLNTIQADQKKSDWLIFGLGVVTTLGAGWMASKLIKN